MRRRFAFRLGRVRRVREIEERLARATWSQAEGEAAEAEMREADRRRERDRSRRELARELGPRGGERLDPARVLISERALANETRALALARERALTLRAQAERLAADWRDRERDRRALVELEERARARHRRELERWEGAQLDEAALARRIRAGLLAARRKTETDSSPVPRPSD